MKKHSVLIASIIMIVLASTAAFADGAVGASAGITGAAVDTMVEAAKYLMNPDNLDGMNVFYFTGSGAWKNKEGTIKIESVPYTFKFDHNGIGVSGVKDDRLFVNGILVTLGEGEGPFAPARAKDGKTYLINADGKIVKNGTSKKCKDVYYAVSKKGAIGMFDEQDDAKKFAKSSETKDQDVEYIN